MIKINLQNSKLLLVSVTLLLNIFGIIFAFLTSLFLLVFSTLFFINIFVITKYKRTGSIYIKQLLVTLFLFLLISTLVNLYSYIDSYKTRNISPKAKLSPSSHTLLREYSRSFPEGFKLKNQSIRYSLVMNFSNKHHINIYDVTYHISDRQRISNKLNENKPICPKYILIGDSHNFGQALDFEMTLQGKLSKIGTTSNLAVPGYGLNNSIAALIDFRNNPVIKDCNDEFSNTLIIYRMIDDHINRNTGKTSFNPFGPKYGLNNNSTHSFCGTSSSCLSYLWNYFRASLINRFLSSDELLTRKIGGILYGYTFYQKSDIDYSIFLTEKLIATAKEYYPLSRIAILVEDGDYDLKKDKFSPSKHLMPFLNSPQINKLSDTEIVVKMSSIISQNKNLPIECKNLDSLYIPFEGHPNHCNNIILFNHLLK